MQVFADNLRKHADALGISHAEIARRAGLTARAFSHYVTGEREPNLPALVRVSAVLGVTPDVLLGVEPEKGKNNDERTRLMKRVVSACEPLDLADLQLVDAIIQTLSERLPVRSND